MTPADKECEARITAAGVAVACTVGKVLTEEATLAHLGKARGVDLSTLRRAGTLLWADPMTGETRYTAPGDKMYSIALMYATEVIGSDGSPEPLDWD